MFFANKYKQLQKADQLELVLDRTFPSHFQSREALKPMACEQN